MACSYILQRGREAWSPEISEPKLLCAILPSLGLPARMPRGLRCRQECRMSDRTGWLPTSKQDTIKGRDAEERSKAGLHDEERRSNWQALVEAVARLNALREAQT